jgi:hypothetical protein
VGWPRTLAERGLEVGSRAKLLLDFRN